MRRNTRQVRYSRAACRCRCRSRRLISNSAPSHCARSASKSVRFAVVMTTTLCVFDWSNHAGINPYYGVFFSNKNHFSESSQRRARQQRTEFFVINTTRPFYFVVVNDDSEHRQNRSARMEESRFEFIFCFVLVWFVVTRSANSFRGSSVRRCSMQLQPIEYGMLLNLNHTNQRERVAL